MTIDYNFKGHWHPIASFIMVLEDQKLENILQKIIISKEVLQEYYHLFVESWMGLALHIKEPMRIFFLFAPTWRASIRAGRLR